jgi:magnesium transporter
VPQPDDQSVQDPPAITGTTTPVLDAQEEEREVPAPTSDELEAVRAAIEEQYLSGAEPDYSAALLLALRPPDQALVVAQLEEDTAQTLMEVLDSEQIASFIEHMDADEAVELSSLIPHRKLADVLDRTEPDVAADVLRGIGWDEASRILMRMSDRQAIGNLLLYRDDDAGGLMTTNVVALRDKWPAPHAINMLRTSGLDKSYLRQLFVVSDTHELLGRLELPDLVFARPGSTVSDVMDPDVISVQTGTDQEEAAKLMARYELRAIPVVDVNGRLEGAISIEDLVQVAEEEATEDMFRMAGTGSEDTVQGPVMVSVRSRLPWLIANILTVLLVAAVLTLFENTLDTIAILAVYMPMVMNQAGVAGTQVTTVVVRSMALDEITTASTGRLLRREYILAALNGGVVSLVMGTVVGLWRLDVYLGLVVFAAMLGSYFVAASVGVLVPMAMSKLKIDPATASGVVLTTFTDIAGGGFYLGLATIFLSLLRN